MLILGCGRTEEQPAEPRTAEPVLISAFVDAGGARTYYEEMGSGEPLVLIHGGLLDRRMWDRQFEVFKDLHDRMMEPFEALARIS